jgi:hypothetical protein
MRKGREGQPVRHPGAGRDPLVRVPNRGMVDPGRSLSSGRAERGPVGRDDDFKQAIGRRPLTLKRFSQFVMAVPGLDPGISPGHPRLQTDTTLTRDVDARDEPGQGNGALRHLRALRVFVVNSCPSNDAGQAAASVRRRGPRPRAGTAGSACCAAASPGAHAPMPARPRAFRRAMPPRSRSR